VIEAAQAAAIPRVVFASSAAVYGDCAALPLTEDAPKHPLTPYGAAKLASEELLLGAARTYGFTAVCLRYFNVFGPRQLPGSPYSGVISKFVDCCQRGVAPKVFGDGQQTRDFVQVRDIAAAVSLAALHEGLPLGAYNVASGHETSLLALLDVLRSLRPAMPAPVFLQARAGDILRSVGDARRFQAATGFTPRQDLRAGLAELVDAS
jgi:UDP-glucose 4-epimerase